MNLLLHGSMLLIYKLGDMLEPTMLLCKKPFKKHWPNPQTKRHEPVKAWCSLGWLVSTFYSLQWQKLFS
jgi:hypothetical protein